MWFWKSVLCGLLAEGYTQKNGADWVPPFHTAYGQYYTKTTLEYQCGDR